jgi:hypothetical protein
MVKVDLAEWLELAERLVSVNEDRFEELVAAMRDIVDAEEILANAPRRGRRRIRDVA